MESRSNSQNSNNIHRVKIIVLLAGRRCSGKTYIAKRLVNEFGFGHIELSTIAKILRDENKRTDLRLRKFVELKHQDFGRAYLIKNLIKNGSLNSTKIVISGVRHYEELVELKSLFASKVISFYLHEPLSSRLIRTIRRPERSNIKEFFIEEGYSIKWQDWKIRNESIIIDKRKEVKAFPQIVQILNAKGIIKLPPTTKGSCGRHDPT